MTMKCVLGSVEDCCDDDEVGCEEEDCANAASGQTMASETRRILASRAALCEGAFERQRRGRATKHRIVALGSKGLIMGDSGFPRATTRRYAGPVPGSRRFE